MIDHRAGRPGRPLRALAVLGGLVVLWFGLRLPMMDAQLQTAAALLAPARLAVAAATPAPAKPMPPVVVSPHSVSVSVFGPLSGPVSPPQRQPMLLFVPVSNEPPSPMQPIMLPVERPEPEAAAKTMLHPETRSEPASPASLTANAAVLAQTGYARLRAGQAAQAAALLDAALALEPGNRQWQADRAALGRRWQIGGFSLLRSGEAANAEAGVAASPVLGGGQIGASVAVLADPYARRPLALVVRGNVAGDLAGIRSETAQAAIGIRQAILPGVSISGERLVAIGAVARGDWTLRLAAGGARGRLDGYGEAGVLGSGQVYAGAQASARLLRVGPAVLAAAAWASVQTGSLDVWRVDIGPALGVQFKGIRVQADYRYRAGGNAAPGSGPALTVSAGY